MIKRWSFSSLFYVILISNSRIIHIIRRKFIRRTLWNRISIWSIWLENKFITFEEMIEWYWREINRFKHKEWLTFQTSSSNDKRSTPSMSKAEYSFNLFFFSFKHDNNSITLHLIHICSLCFPLYMNQEDTVDYEQVHWLLSKPTSMFIKNHQMSLCQLFNPKNHDELEFIFFFHPPKHHHDDTMKAWRTLVILMQR